MNWDILGPFSFTSCPNEINILKLEQLNNQMTISIYEFIRETSLYTRQEVEHFSFFFCFLAAGLVDKSSEFLNFSNASNTKKKM